MYSQFKAHVTKVSSEWFEHGVAAELERVRGRAPALRLRQAKGAWQCAARCAGDVCVAVRYDRPTSFSARKPAALTPHCNRPTHRDDASPPLSRSPTSASAQPLVPHQLQHVHVRERARRELSEERGRDTALDEKELAQLSQRPPLHRQRQRLAACLAEVDDRREQPGVQPGEKPRREPARDEAPAAAAPQRRGARRARPPPAAPPPRRRTLSR